MKITKFLAMALAAMTMISCQKDNVDQPGGEEINTPTYATFKFNLGGGSKVASDYDPSTTPDQDAADSKIGQLQMLIFNATTQKLEFNEIVTTGESSKTVLLTAGRKKIFFIANNENLTDYTLAIAPGTFLPGAANSTLTDFYSLNFSAGEPQGLVTDKDATARTFDIKPLHSVGGPASGLPMSNTNEVTYDLIAGISQAEAEGALPSEDGNDKNAFLIKLHYMVAKANLKLSPTVLNVDATNGKPIITNVMFAIRNLARCTKYVQHVPVAGQPQSYYYLSSFADQAEYDEEFDYASNITIPLTESASDYLYVPENNHSVLKRGQASYFAIKARYEPIVKTEAVYDVNTTVQYTEKSLAVSGSLDYIYTTADVEGIPAGTYFATKALFAKAAWIMKFKTDYTSANANDAAALIPNNTYLDFSDATSYYRVDLGSTSTSGATEYGVLRSNKYNATINKITGPGVPKEKDLVEKPGDPVSAKTYIQATIVPAQWTPVSQSADL